MKAIVDTLIAWGPLGVLILTLLDSAGVPLPAVLDAYVVFTSTAGWNAAFWTALMAVAGSTAGNMILFLIARKGGEAYLAKHCLSPAAQRFQRWFLHYGLLTVFIPALIPIPLPLKIFVISAGALGVSKRAFLATVLAARVPRYFGLAFLGVKAGESSFEWFKDNALLLTAGSVALFLALLFAIKMKDRASAEG